MRYEIVRLLGNATFADHSQDPFHIASYVKALVAGLQGPSGAEYQRIAATCKHFTGYDVENWHGYERFEFDAQISIQDLAEYHAPSFQACAREANVSAFMCTYSQYSIDRLLSCANSARLCEWHSYVRG